MDVQELQARMSSSDTETAEKLFKLISDTLNGGASDYIFQYVLEMMSREHRTIQQMFSNVTLWWLRKLIAQHNESRFDVRNASSCILAKEIYNSLPERIQYAYFDLESVRPPKFPFI
jgi:hypothetical protein